MAQRRCAANGENHGPIYPRTKPPQRSLNNASRRRWCTSPTLFPQPPVTINGNMHGNLVPRRTQFSSCDACRKSRVACDAMKGRSALTSPTSMINCSRCQNRGQQCTFEWIEKATLPNSKKNYSVGRRKSTSATSIAASPNDISTDGSPSVESQSRNQSVQSSKISYEQSPITQSTNANDIEWLQWIYMNIFEGVFGSWLGNYSCPYVFHKNGMQDQQGPTLSVSIASLCYECDQWMKRVQGEESQIQLEDAASPGETEYDQQINRSLLQAICAFSARWLLLNDTSESSLKASSMDRIDDLWRTVRRDTLRVMNRPCYRSALTLFVFASTPIPAGISEEEESDGVPAQVCVQAALQQVLNLRALQRSIEFNGSKVSPIPRSSNSITSGTPVTNSFLGVESMIYWAALTFDTSSSLTLNTKSLLSPGLNLGMESESPWRLAQTCTNIFHQESEKWRTHGVYITEEIANQIIASAASYKLFIWKSAAVVKEALREGLEEEVVQKVFAMAVDAVEQFSLTYRELLAGCERRIQFFGHDTKLRWYEVILHYNLSILIMLNAIEIAERTDLMEKMTVVKASAEGTLLNCLIFGLNNQFHIPLFNNELQETQDMKDGEQQASTRSVPLIAIDPYPHHVVAAVRILWKAVERDLENDCLDKKVAEKTQGILLDTLTLLPQASKSVNMARQQAEASFLGRQHNVDSQVPN